LDERIFFLYDGKKFPVLPGPETIGIGFHAEIRVAELADQIKRIVLLGIISFDILTPAAQFGAGIGRSVIYLTAVADLYKKGIAVKLDMILRLGNQLLWNSAGILQPFAVQILLPAALHIRVKAAAG
jgi:hypothetical protein